MHLRIHIIFLGILIAGCSHVNQAQTASSRGFRSTLIQAEKSTFKKGAMSLPYRLVAPEALDNNKKYPLLIYLHGMGTRGSDNELPLEKFALFFIDTLSGKNKLPCYVVIPQCPMNDLWVNFPGFPESLATPAKATAAGTMVVQLVRELMRTRNIDSTRIYLTGYSMGGEGTFDLLSREPGLFACGVPVASVADTARASALARVPIWAFHGEKDQVIDVKYSRLSVAAIRKKGGAITFTEVPDCGHDCRTYAYDNAALWNWMFSQKKQTD